jgi:hypothetical protein
MNIPYMGINKKLKATILMTLFYAGLALLLDTSKLIHYLFLVGCVSLLGMWICVIALYLLED